MLKRLCIYVDASVVGGCEDIEFADTSRALWDEFIAGRKLMALSEHTLRELAPAPAPARKHLESVPPEHVVVLEDSHEAELLADAYLKRGIVGPGSHADALHVVLATTGGVDVLVTWNFKHIVNLGRIRLFNAVNLEQGYGTIDIRTPKEVLTYDEGV